MRLCCRGPSRSGWCLAGLVMAVATLATVAYGEDEYGLPVALTMGLVTLSLVHLAAAISTRDPEHSGLSAAAFVNRQFVYLSGLVLVLTLLVTELGILQRIFETVSLTGDQWSICLIASGAVLAIFEVAKIVLRRTGLLSVTASPSATEIPPPSMAISGEATVSS